MTTAGRRKVLFENENIPKYASPLNSNNQLKTSICIGGDQDSRFAQHSCGVRRGPGHLVEHVDEQSAVGLAGKK
jgi:hypothetical protein